MKAIKAKFGPHVYKLRMEQRISLRDFSIKSKSDPGNISRMERGLVPPPQSVAILKRFAVALGVPTKGDEWHQFSDLAFADKGIIPPDLMDDRIVSFLPAFYSTARGKATEEEMRALIAHVRKADTQPANWE